MTKIIVGTNDLATINPELAGEWDYEKNENLKPSDVTSGSNKKVWWKCKKGHSWESSINNRSNGNGCPYCSGKKAITGKNDLATTNPTLVAEWDFERNGDLKPTNVSAGSHKKIWWLCKKGHSYSSFIIDRTKGNGCPYCSNQKVWQGFNDLATTNPALAEEWNYEKNGDLKPTDVTVGSDKKVWWKCKQGHSWNVSICNRLKGSGCPYCANQKVWQGFNDLATTNPALAEEWDYKKNGNLKPTDVTAHSNKKVWWICNQGHSWKSKLNNRSNGNNCPACGRKKTNEARRKLVICAETNEQFESVKQAAEKYKLHHSSISACCSGKQKTAGGYHWKYAVDVDPSIQE